MMAENIDGCDECFRLQEKLDTLTQAHEVACNATLGWCEQSSNMLFELRKDYAPMSPESAETMGPLMIAKLRAEIVSLKSKVASSPLPSPTAKLEELTEAAEAVLRLKDEEKTTRRMYPAGTAGAEEAWRDFGRHEDECWRKLSTAVHCQVVVSDTEWSKVGNLKPPTEGQRLEVGRRGVGTFVAWFIE